MCNSYECGCNKDEVKEVELTVEEIVETYIDILREGGCLSCTLQNLFELGYELGRREMAETFRSISEEILDEE